MSSRWSHRRTPRRPGRQSSRRSARLRSGSRAHGRGVHPTRRHRAPRTGGPRASDAPATSPAARQVRTYVDDQTIGPPSSGIPSTVKPCSAPNACRVATSPEALRAEPEVGADHDGPGVEGVDQHPLLELLRRPRRHVSVERQRQHVVGTRFGEQLGAAFDGGELGRRVLRAQHRHGVRVQRHRDQCESTLVRDLPRAGEHPAGARGGRRRSCRSSRPCRPRRPARRRANARSPRREL